MPADPTAILAHCDELFKEQTNWSHTWQDISDYVYPVKSNIETLETPGEVRATERYDTTAEDALIDSSSGLVGWLTPLGNQWLLLKPKNENAPQSIHDWYRECSRIQLEALMSSNFYLTWHEDCIDGMAFGSSATFVEGNDNKLLNYVSWPIGTWAFSVDNDEKPDYICRKWKWSARQAVGAFGEENVSDTIRKAYQEGGQASEKKFELRHVIYKRKEGEYKQGAAEGKLRPWASVYLCVEDKEIIEEDGYYECPVAISRILKSNSEKYGRSPAMGCLPEIKQLNRMEYDILLAVEKMVNPPWLMPDDSTYDPDNRPNGVTYFNAANPNSKPEQQRYENRIDLGEQKTAQKRDRIKKAFFVDMFQMLTDLEFNSKQKTAYEVQKMVEERIVLFTPIFARLIQEKLNPLMERTFAILFRAGKFPQPPAEIAEWGGEYEITYNSRIALAIKALQNGQLMQALDFLRMTLEIDPQARHVLNIIKATRGALTNMALPGDWINSEEVIEERIEAENQQAQMAAAAQMAQMGADAVGKLPPEMMKQMG